MLTPQLKNEIHRAVRSAIRSAIRDAQPPLTSDRLMKMLTSPPAPRRRGERVTEAASAKGKPLTSDDLVRALGGMPQQPSPRRKPRG